MLFGPQTNKTTFRRYCRQSNTYTHTRAHTMAMADCCSFVCKRSTTFAFKLLVCCNDNKTTRADVYTISHLSVGPSKKKTSKFISTSIFRHSLDIFRNFEAKTLSYLTGQRKIYIDFHT